MSISAQPRVVRQIPTIMVWVLIDYDRVTIPEPVIHERIVVRSDTEIGAVKPKAIPVSSRQPEDMTGSEAEGEASMFPGTIYMVMGIVTTGIMSDPPIVGV